MGGIFIILGLVAIILLGFISLVKSFGRKRKLALPLPASSITLLEQHVLFYKKLDNEQKKIFDQRVAHFLSQVRITGINTQVEDLDRVLIAASAIIPIFGFPDWEYINLNEVLLYPETFNEDFEQTGTNRPVMGMVGNGPMQQVMIISRHSLRQGFSNRTDKSNTAIHEFVHLIDKTDGETDGMPEVLLHHYSQPWVRLMHKNIKEIMKNKSDINPYGATNEAEFFAVVSEYFFEKPELLKSKHPELYGMLKDIFNK
jgi:Mlc titration factor MtfA (ptsG expression regulator)